MSLPRSPAIKYLSTSLLPLPHSSSSSKQAATPTRHISHSHHTLGGTTCSGASERAMEKSTKMVAVVAALVLAVAAATSAEARNIKTTEATSKDAVVQPQTFPPFDRFGSASPAFGGLPGGIGSSIPGFSLPGNGGIGSMPFLGGFGGGSPGLGGMPGSPAAAVNEHAKKP